jgi:CDP-diacylglycerol--serine O-phosphatidyltransferase
MRLLLPNMVTLLALCSGLTAIRLGIEDKLDLAIYAVVFAALLDGIDGRVARLLKSTSRFGAELDSLTDFVNFGVAPAILLYTAFLYELRSIGWIAALVFAIAAALRLARFNISLDDPAKPAWASHFFVGMPAPAGAITVLLPIYLEFLGLPHLPGLALPVLGYALAIAFLMVSRVPTYSGKRVGRRVPREAVLPLFVVTVLFAALLVSFPWIVLTLGTLAYLAAIPFGVRRYRELSAEESLAVESAEGGEPSHRPDLGAADRSVHV